MVDDGGQWDPTRLERFGRRLRIAMVGGGLGSFIGEAHRIAFRVDGMWELVAGAFSRNPATSAATGRALLLDPERVYPDYRALIAAEASRPDRPDAVLVATLPDTHEEICSALLEAGFHVIAEKPLTSTVDQAERVVDAVGRTGRRLLLTHCDSGYPMVRQARDMVADGSLGRVTVVDTEFSNGSQTVPGAGGAWRVDATQVGEAGMLLDVGTHALHLVTYVTGVRIDTVSARLHRLDPRHTVFDNAFLDLGLAGGAVGRCWSTFQAAGSVHGLRISVVGELGSVHWVQTDPEVLWWRPANEPAQLLTRAGTGATAGAVEASRFAPGHPDGYGLAFANLYRDFGEALLAEALGEDPTPLLAGVPDQFDGLHTLEVVDAALRSAAAEGRSVTVRDPALRARR
ncbi:Gfo/Idh/MocA family protein [Tsukamurella soli]|uniref:Gfo/Idh/MocA family oxidoreductase n=1 Tax=Tsukamurella soli TaxID=644556 RepID=A0ABP8JHL9_9ACTN